MSACRDGGAEELVASVFPGVMVKLEAHSARKAGGEGPTSEHGRPRRQSSHHECITLGEINEGDNVAT